MPRVAAAENFTNDAPLIGIKDWSNHEADPHHTPRQQKVSGLVQARSMALPCRTQLLQPRVVAAEQGRRHLAASVRL